MLLYFLMEHKKFLMLLKVKHFQKENKGKELQMTYKYFRLGLEP